MSHRTIDGGGARPGALAAYDAEAGSRSANRLGRFMEELIRTNDLVLISFVEVLMRDAGIPTLVADQAVSAVDGSIGIFPRRILVDRDDARAARRILVDAGLAGELWPVDGP